MLINQFIIDNIQYFIGGIIGCLLGIIILSRIQYNRLDRLLTVEELRRDAQIRTYMKAYAKVIYGTSSLNLLKDDELDKLLEYANQEYEEELKRIQVS